MLRLLTVFSLTIHFALTASPGTIGDELDAEIQFEWKKISPFAISAGLKGYSGFQQEGDYFVMGGSTFPVPQNQGGEKVYFDSVFRLKNPLTNSPSWEKQKDILPYPIAEGGSVPVENGVILVGGHNSQKVFDKVLRVVWDSTKKTLGFEQLPPLPRACFYAAATKWKNKLFVAGGHNGITASNDFWVLDLNDIQQGWTTLPSWPGPKRFGAILQVLSVGKKEYLYLFSGKTESTQARSQQNYLKDVYQYDPIDRSWQQMNDMPRAALIGVFGKITSSRMVILSGSDGHDIERLEEIGDAYRFPREIWVYSSTNDSWSHAGEMPIGLVGVPLFPCEGGFILGSGEYSPGKRSNTVYRITISGNSGND